MNFSSLMNAFGLGSQNDDDPSLGQGRQLNDFNRTYTKQIGPQLKQLQETGIPGVSSITEAMDTSKPNVGVQTRKADKVSELEDQFSKKLAEYNAAYKLFSEAVVKTNTADKEIQQYFGQAITSGDLMKPIACPDHTVTRRELVDVFLAWAKRNGNLLDSEGPIHGVMRAASAKWPCK